MTDNAVSPVDEAYAEIARIQQRISESFLEYAAFPKGSENPDREELEYTDKAKAAIFAALVEEARRGYDFLLKFEPVHTAVIEFGRQCNSLTYAGSQYEDRSSWLNEHFLPSERIPEIARQYKRDNIVRFALRQWLWQRPWFIAPKLRAQMTALENERTHEWAYSWLAAQVRQAVEDAREQWEILKIVSEG